MSLFNSPTLASGIARAIALMACAGVLLGLLGPFGTYQQLTLAERMGFWVGSTFLGAAIHMPLFWAAAWLGKTKSLPLALWVTVSGVVAAVPMTFVVNGMFASMFPGTRMNLLTQLYPYVLLISVPMQWVSWATSSSTLRHLGWHSAAVATDVESQAVKDTQAARQGLAVPAESLHAPLPQPPSASSAPFLKRIPARYGTDLICLEMEDHYLRISTAVGDTMVHGRMADAEAELAGLEGMRVHRSWWVARTAVKGWTRDGKTLNLTLRNGKTVPVARDRQPLLKAAGWLS
jgi:LytTr DNA-binding domain